jgi:hypothetical protein
MMMMHKKTYDLHQPILFVLLVQQCKFFLLKARLHISVIGENYSSKQACNRKVCITDFSDPDWIQTNDLLLRRQLLYSLSYRTLRIYDFRFCSFNFKPQTSNIEHHALNRAKIIFN